ncbi:testis-expressed protein 13A isoform X2 [Macaca nemestrina]|uniref:testis-expressed protein 13A isoform X2 n=1 Tax=Macaca nemestrina TaxID=9545 RepID=UPI0039B9B3E3
MALRPEDPSSGFRHSNVVAFINEKMARHTKGPEFYLENISLSWEEVEDKLRAILEDSEVPSEVKEACTWGSLALGVRFARRQAQLQRHRVRWLHGFAKLHKSAAQALASDLKELKAQQETERKEAASRLRMSQTSFVEVQKERDKNTPQPCPLLSRSWRLPMSGSRGQGGQAWPLPEGFAQKEQVRRKKRQRWLLLVLLEEKEQKKSRGMWRLSLPLWRPWLPPWRLGLPRWRPWLLPWRLRLPPWRLGLPPRRQSSPTWRPGLPPWSPQRSWRESSCSSSEMLIRKITPIGGRRRKISGIPTISPPQATVTAPVPTQLPSDWGAFDTSLWSDGGPQRVDPQEHPRDRRYSEPHQQRRPPVYRRPGDWDCPWCNAVNFSRRDTCFDCGRGIWLQKPH